MPTPKRTKRAAAPKGSKELNARQEALDNARKLRKIEQSIAVETRRVARLLRASNDRLASVLHGYLEQTGRTVINAARWDAMVAEHASAMEQNEHLRTELGSARTAELERKVADEKGRERETAASRN